MPVTLQFSGGLELAIPDYADTLNVGRRVWPASLMLCQWLSLNHRRVEGQVVLELGSGTGICAAAAAKCGASSVWLQDLPGCGEDGMLGDQRQMMAANGVSEYRQLGLRWGERLPEGLPPFGLVISSDTFYDESQFEPLLATVHCLLRQSPRAEFVTAYHDRDMQYYIGDLLRLWGLAAQPISGIPVPPGDTLRRAQARLGSDWPECFASTVFLLRITAQPNQ